MKTKCKYCGFETPITKKTICGECSYLRQLKPMELVDETINNMIIIKKLEKIKADIKNTVNGLKKCNRCRKERKNNELNKKYKLCDTCISELVNSYKF